MAQQNTKSGAGLSTQQHLPFSAIYDDVIVTKKGQLCQVIMVNSVNFGLKSEEEQNAIIYQYQSFLNSLSFPIEIVMHSKKLDLTDYLKNLESKITQEPNELIRYQIQEYVDFVGKLISIANIMDKKFFIVIPFVIPPTEISSGGGIASFFGGSHDHLKVPLGKFMKFKEALVERTNVVASGLSSIGITSQVLSTKQLIELFYRTYNPDEAIKEQLKGDVEAIGVEKSESAPQGAEAQNINTQGKSQ